MSWESVIGLEVHVQLATQSKIFSGASTMYGAKPNTQACLVDLGFPGVLPVLNEAVVIMAVKFGLSIQSQIPAYSIFARKNYFYPDLPKGYQISQHHLPIVVGGQIPIVLTDEEDKNKIQHKIIQITRAHLEEDAGKSSHNDIENISSIDLNRAGVPLLEIVSEPDMRSAKEAVAYLKVLHTLVRYLGICDGNMQEGSFRCDVNVSIRQKGTSTLGTRAEIKNVNSFRFVERAINYEIQRQIDILENNGVVKQETRVYDADKDETRAMRSKENAHDYRYFPDPDLLPLKITPEWVEQIRLTLPELPQQKKARFIAHYQLSDYDANILTSEAEWADYFEKAVSLAPSHAKLIANWIIGDLLCALHKANFTITDSPISAEQLATLVLRIADNTISGKIAKVVFEALWQEKGEVDQIIAQKGLKQITDESMIENIIDEILNQYTEQVASYRSGKETLFGFFVGQVMKVTQGKANPQRVNILLKEKLKG